MHYTPEDILAILQADYRQAQNIDPFVIKGRSLNFDTTILEWREILDLEDTDVLWTHLNSQFSLTISKEKWTPVLQPEYENTLNDLCLFISTHSVKPVLQPVTLFGNDCKTASIFRILLTKLKNRGLDVSSIRPSSNLNTLFQQYKWTIIQEINLLDPVALPSINMKANIIHKCGLRLLLLSIMSIGYLLYKQNMWVLLPITALMPAFVMMYAGSKQMLKSATFPSVTTLADVIRRIDIKHFNEPAA